MKPYNYTPLRYNMYRDQSIRIKFSMDLTFSVTVPLSGKPGIAGIFYGKS